MKNSNRSLDKLKHTLIKKKIITSNRPIPEISEGEYLCARDLVVSINENPRMLAPSIVLLVNYPSIIDDEIELPEDIMNTVKSLRKCRKVGPDCRYESYRNLYQLCEFSPDGRVRGVNKKIRKNIRLSGDVQEIIDELVADGSYSSETEVIEESIRKLKG